MSNSSGSSPDLCEVLRFGIHGVECWTKVLFNIFLTPRLKFERNLHFLDSWFQENSAA